MDGLKDKVVAITGAGIGEATALLLAARGAKVMLGARRSNRLEKLAQRIARSGDKAVYAATDVTRRAVVTQNAPARSTRKLQMPRRVCLLQTGPRGVLAMRRGVSVGGVEYCEAALFAGHDFCDEVVAAAATGGGPAMVANLGHTARASGTHGSTNVAVGEGVAVADEHRGL